VAAVYFTAPDKTKFTYSWKEALDPLGWLYGAAILSIQSGFAADSGNGVLKSLCFASSAASLLLLLSAMTDRGADANWKPPTSLQRVSGALVVAVLLAGFYVHKDALEGRQTQTPCVDGRGQR
jgi:hypothetical protein